MLGSDNTITPLEEIGNGNRIGKNNRRETPICYSGQYPNFDSELNVCCHQVPIWLIYSSVDV